MRGALNSQASRLFIRAAVFAPSARLHIALHSASEGRAPRIAHAMAAAGGLCCFSSFLLFFGWCVWGGEGERTRCKEKVVVGISGI